MRIIDLVTNDLAQIVRDKRSFLFLLAMPIAFTIFMGFAYQSDEDAEPPDSPISFAWVETNPAGKYSQMLFARVEESDALNPIRMQQNAALESLKQGKVAGVLVVPVGFGKHPTRSFTVVQKNESPVWQIKLIADTTSSKGHSLYQLLQAPVFQLVSAVEISQMSVATLGSPDEFTPSLELAWKKWGESSSQELIRVQPAKLQTPENWLGDNPYNQASPGVLVQFAIMGLVTTAEILVRERKSRTLQRLMTTALKPWEILVGHMLAMFIIVFMQTVMLVIFGQLVLKVDYFRDPASVLLIAVALGLWVSSMGLLIGLLAKGNEQVVLFSMVAMLIFSALGGAWFPLETSGRVFAIIGKTLPSAWAITGLQNVLIRGLHLSSAWQPAGIVLLYALGFFLIAVWKFKRIEG